LLDPIVSRKVHVNAELASAGAGTRGTDWDSHRRKECPTPVLGTGLEPDALTVAFCIS
jgi:hypothetical protein